LPDRFAQNPCPLLALFSAAPNCGGSVAAQRLLIHTTGKSKIVGMRTLLFIFNWLRIIPGTGHPQERWRKLLVFQPVLWITCY
jgi:hypothetical protein